MRKIALLIATVLIMGGCATTRVVKIDGNGRPEVALKGGQISMNSISSREELRVGRLTTDLMSEVEQRKADLANYECQRQLDAGWQNLELQSLIDGKLVAPATTVTEGTLPVVVAYYGDYNEHRIYEIWYLGKKRPKSLEQMSGQRTIRVLVPKGSYKVEHLKSGWYGYRVRDEDGRILSLKCQGTLSQNHKFRVHSKPVEEYPPSSRVYYHGLVWSSR